MAESSLTVEDILELLPDEEKQEVLREDFIVPLKHFLTGYNRSNSFPPAEALSNRFRNYARCRVAVKNEIIKNPDIHKVEIKDPIFIIGLARSGTTLLQRLMTTDPKILSPMLWEMIEPVPPGRPENWRESERFKKVSKNPDVLAMTSGGMDHWHQMRIDLPEECFAILRLFFLGLLPSENMTELVDFLINCPDKHVTHAYQFHKMCLQCLFYGNLKQETRVLLKSPAHCLYLETIKKIYPTARFIFPYRNAKDAVASFSALINNMWNMQTNKDNRKAAVQRVLQVARHSTLRVIHFFKTLPKERYISVPYEELVNNPIETVKQIYSHFSLKIEPETVESMQEYMKENYQHKHGKVQYKAEDYGITDEVLKEHLQEYLEFCKNSSEEL